MSDTDSEILEPVSRQARHLKVNESVKVPYFEVTHKDGTYYRGMAVVEGRDGRENLSLIANEMKMSMEFSDHGTKPIHCQLMK